MALLEVPYPIDEVQHYAYVHSIATGGGIPVVGRDKVPVEILEVAKVSPTWWYRAHPLEMTPEDPEWEIIREQYEAVQPPLYYLAMAPIYLAFQPAGALATLYALRIATLLLCLTAIPLTWWLARIAFPQRPLVWILSPALLVAIQGFNGNFAAPNNDALLLPLSVLVLIATLRSCPRLGIGNAIGTGALLGAAFFAKLTALVLIPVIVTVLLLRAWSRAQHLNRLVGWLALVGATALAIVSPWIVWNMATYGETTAGQAAAAVTDPAQVQIPLNLDGFIERARIAVGGFWQVQQYGYGKSQIAVLVGGSILALGLGIGAGVRRRQSAEARMLVLLGIAFPLSFLTMLLVVYTVFGGAGAFSGRHLYAVLAPSILLIAAGFVIALGPRMGTTAVLSLATLVMWTDGETVTKFSRSVYTTGILQNKLVPTIDQSWNDEYVIADRIDVIPNCPVQMLGIGMSGSRIEQVTVIEGRRRSPAFFAGILDEDSHAGDGWTLFALPQAKAGPFHILLPPNTPIGSSRSERDRAVSFPDPSRDPMVRAYCTTTRPAAARFSQRYGPLHPGWIEYEKVVAWPKIWASIGLSALVLWLLVSQRSFLFQDRS